jgi:serine/threonine protein kinase
MPLLLHLGVILARAIASALLGQGGMGRVCKAYDKDLDRVVALKVVRHGVMGETDALKRFKQELVLASKISHKNILRIHDMGEVGGTKFITMAYVEGQDLYGILQENPKLPIERVLKFARALAEALAAAHAEGVIHRDLKPQNILVNKDDQIFVSDFGLAKSFEEGAQGMTKTGAFLGTPRYMSPEQVEGKPADQRSDLYSYGLMLYEMAVGDVPFTGESTLKVMYQRIQEKPKNPKLITPLFRPGLCGSLCAVSDGIPLPVTRALMRSWQICKDREVRRVARTPFKSRFPNSSRSGAGLGSSGHSRVAATCFCHSAGAPPDSRWREFQNEHKRIRHSSALTGQIRSDSSVSNSG